LEKDRDLGKAILSRCENPRCVDLTGYTRTIRELISIFHLASLLITNDGGPGHFAAMTPIPSIIFYGPETPALYGPLDGKAEVFYAGLSCSPCLTAYNHRNSPCDGDNVCLKSIHPDDVLTKALEMLEGKRSVAPIVNNHDKGSSSAGGKSSFAGTGRELRQSEISGEGTRCGERQRKKRLEVNPASRDVGGRPWIRVGAWITRSRILRPL